MKFKHYKSVISEIIKEIGLDTFKLRNKNILSLTFYPGIEKRKINYLFKSLKELIN
ncbi:hypothetical protein OA508_03630 [Candidatus Pelagibacter sp.]|nr:hypothetical protein [Candidatus Pelagibacter sp.]